MRAILIPTGQKPRRRAPPRPLRPTLIEQDYARSLRRLVDLVRAAFAPLHLEGPGLLDAAAREREDDDRTDAGEGKRVRELVELGRVRLAASLADNESTLENLAREIAQRTEAHHANQLRRHVRSVLAVDVLVDDRKLAATMDGFVAENVALIKAIPQDVATKVEQVVTRGVASGQRWRDVAKDVDASYDFGRKRAQLVARDQVGKFYGQIAQTRQKDLGVTKYIWRTVHDRRVRGTPGGAFPRARYSHFSRDGQTFEWEHPPPDGHPGEPILCRCYAEPVLDHILGDFENEDHEREVESMAAAAEVAPVPRRRRAAKKPPAPPLESLTGDAIGALQEEWNDWHRGLSSAERDALQFYTGSGYTPMNGGLRGQSVSSQLAREIETLDRALAKREIGKEILVHRGMGAQEPIEFKVGGVLHDRGYLSTSVKEEVASDFTAGSPHKYFFRIELPADTRAAYLGKNSDHPDEFELLLPRGAELEILEVETMPGRWGTHNIIRARLRGVRLDKSDEQKRREDAEREKREREERAARFVWKPGDFTYTPPATK